MKQVIFKRNDGFYMTNKKGILLSISVLGLISSLFFALPSKNFQSVEASVGNHTTGTNVTDYYSNFDFNKSVILE